MSTNEHEAWCDCGDGIVESGACSTCLMVLRDELKQAREALALKELSDHSAREAIRSELIMAGIEADKQLTSLVTTLVALFGWEEPSFLHALMHVENAVLNERADRAVVEQALEQTVKALENVLESKPVRNADEIILFARSQIRGPSA